MGPARLIIGVNSFGVHFLEESTRVFNRSYSFERINRWGGTAKLFSFSITKKEDQLVQQRIQSTRGKISSVAFDNNKVKSMKLKGGLIKNIKKQKKQHNSFEIS